MPIKAILFDMFDTLMMIEKGHAFYSPAVKSMHQYVVKSGVPVSFAKFRDAYIKARDLLYEEADLKLEEPHFDMRVKNALHHLGFVREAQSKIVRGATLAFCEQFMNYVRIDEHTVPVLRKLQNTYNLGLVSNFAIPECVNQLLEREQITPMFKVVIVSGTVNRRKPNPDIFRYALEEMQLDANDTAFVGDTVDADVKGPKEVGMKTIYINRRPQKDLEQHQPDFIIKSLKELPDVLEKC